ncbi:MAG: cell division protein FtsI [Rubrivivax sp.]
MKPWNYHGRALLGLFSILPLAGCAIFSPVPAWELVKAAAGATSLGLDLGPVRAVDTVFNLQEPVHAVCIELNPGPPVADLLPSLQAELKRQGVASRVFQERAEPPGCGLWLRYAAQVDWQPPPLADRHEPVVTDLVLTLSRADGRVLASSRYTLDNGFGIGKWAPTRRKVAPVVEALLTGFEG